MTRSNGSDKAAVADVLRNEEPHQSKPSAERWQAKQQWSPVLEIPFWPLTPKPLEVGGGRFYPLGFHS